LCIKNHHSFLKPFFIAFLLLNCVNCYAESENYIFGWTHLNNPNMQSPQGGTSTGPDVDMDKDPNPHWIKLQDPNLTKFEKDRLAILAMQGEHKINFDFMETVGFYEDFEPQKPYQSWGTEFVTVVKDEKYFISLQHVMVMFYILEDGSTSEPMVIKHWRQDWQYQDKFLSEYVGNNTWKKRYIPIIARKGTWSQSVYQADDSPRYHGYGKWRHYKNSSSWTSESTNRPLPRRETTIRNDYDILSGINTHIITPFGWVHEQNNNKLRLDGTILAKEIGLARYQRIKDFDWSAGKDYWNETKLFWIEVSNFWEKIIRKSDEITVYKEIDNKQLWPKLFSLSYEYADDNKLVINDIEHVILDHIKK